MGLFSFLGGPSAVAGDVATGAIAPAVAPKPTTQFGDFGSGQMVNAAGQQGPGGIGVFGTGFDATAGLPGYAGYSPESLLSGNAAARNQTSHQLNQQQAFLNALGMNGGLNANQQNVFNQQGGLANQFQAMANGQGPNPVQRMLAQNTGENISQQAALMGSARGTQSNPGLVAQLATQQGGAIQQRAAGQAATLQAQQQISAMQNVAAQQGQMANLATAGVGQQQLGMSQLGNQNLAYQQMLQGALTTQNQQQMQGRLANAGLAGQSMQNTAQGIGGLLGGLASVGGTAALAVAHGGKIPGYADGGPAEVQDKYRSQVNQPFAPTAQLSSDANPTVPFGSSQNSMYQGAEQAGKFLGSGLSSLWGSMSGGAVPTGSNISDYTSLSNGGNVPGKSKVFGDSEKNDTVPAKLSPGEIVIKRSASTDPHKAAAFLNGLMGWNLRAA